MTLAIPLDDALTSQLRQYAADRQLSIEAFAAQLLHEAVMQLADTACWQQHNQRRVELIHSMTTLLSREEVAELEALQAALDQRLAAMDDQLLTAMEGMQHAVQALPDDAQP